MENITLGEISIAIAFIVAFVGGMKYILTDMKKITERALKPTNDKIDEMGKSLKAEIQKSDLNATKNYLVATLHDIKKGDINDISKQRFFEQYEHYKALGGNSYISNEVDKMRKEGNL